MTTPEHHTPLSAALDTQEFQLEPLPGDTSRLITAPQKRPRPVLLWLAVTGLAGAVIASAFWTQQRIQRLEQQLIATQDSFAAISGDADQSIQRILNQLSHNQDAAKEEAVTLQSHIAQLQHEHNQYGTRTRQHADALSQLTRQHEQLSARLEQYANAAQDGFIAVDSSQQQLNSQLKQTLAQSTELHTQLAQQLDINHAHSQQVAALEVVMDATNQHIQHLEQRLNTQQESLQQLPPLHQELKALLAKQAELEQEFQAYRAQVTRSINNLNQAQQL